MRRIVVGFAMLAIAALAPAWAHADDYKIAEQIVQHLQKQHDAGKLRGFGIDLQVEEGVVRLTGRVSSVAQQRLALDIASRVPGVQRVVDELEISTADKIAASSSKPAVTEEVLMQPSGVAAQFARTGKPVTAKENLAARKDVSASQSLTASAGSAKAAESAAKIASSAQFGRKISQASALSKANQTVERTRYVAARSQTGSPSDKQIAEEIMKRLKREKQAGKLVGFSVEIKPEGGSVWLIGSVSSRQQQQLVLDIASRVQGVRQVINNLVIAPRRRGAASAIPAPVESPRVDKVAAQTVMRRTSPAVQVSQPPAQQAGSALAYVNPQSATGPSLDQGPAIGTGTQLAMPATQLAMPTAAAFVAAGGAPAGMAVAPQMARRPQMPLAFAASRVASRQVQGPAANAGIPGQAVPLPAHMAGGIGVAPARYDHPNLPGYAWPSYAASPNYAAVTYPKQYSPSAWPYIGPFYPYPQVPLGWRKVTLEWDDGWWQLDFNDH